MKTKYYYLISISILIVGVAGFVDLQVNFWKTWIALVGGSMVGWYIIYPNKDCDIKFWRG